jgi:hypothetical protein
MKTIHNRPIKLELDTLLSMSGDSTSVLGVDRKRIKARRCAFIQVRIVTVSSAEQHCPATQPNTQKGQKKFQEK